MTAKKPPFPYVSIIIPMYNAASTLKRCLESLMALSYPADRLEILCVDGRSTDDSREIAEAYRVRMIDNPARGVVSGRNVGFAAARGELIAFSDADCTFDTGWIRNAVRYFNDETVAGVTGPIELPIDQNTLGRCINGLFRLAATFAEGGHENEVEVCRAAKHLPTCNAVFRTAALQNVMPIPEHLVAGEDVAMSHQLQLLGYQLLSVPDVRVQHYKTVHVERFRQTDALVRYRPGTVIADLARITASPSPPCPKAINWYATTHEYNALGKTSSGIVHDWLRLAISRFLGERLHPPVRRILLATSRCLDVLSRLDSRLYRRIFLVSVLEESK